MLGTGETAGNEQKNPCLLEQLIRCRETLACWSVLQSDKVLWDVEWGAEPEVLAVGALIPKVNLLLPSKELETAIPE